MHLVLGASAPHCPARRKHMPRLMWEETFPHAGRDWRLSSVASWVNSEAVLTVTERLPESDREVTSTAFHLDLHVPETGS